MEKLKVVEVVEEEIKPFVGKTWRSNHPVQIRVMDRQCLHVLGMFSATVADIPKLVAAISKAQDGKGISHYLLDAT
jgi:hypothetical protein